MQGMEIRAKYTVFAEGARGHLTKKVIEKFQLDKESDFQKYGIGLKELWEIPEENHKPGLVQHTMGWLLTIKQVEGHLCTILGKNSSFNRFCCSSQL